MQLRSASRHRIRVWGAALLSQFSPQPPIFPPFLHFSPLLHFECSGKSAGSGCSGGAGLPSSAKKRSGTTTKKALGLFFFSLLGKPQGFACSQQCPVTPLVLLAALEDALTFLPRAAAVTEAAANKMLWHLQAEPSYLAAPPSPSPRSCIFTPLPLFSLAGTAPTRSSGSGRRISTTPRCR